MRNILTIVIAAFLSISAMQLAAADSATATDVKACLQMIKDHVRVSPTPKVAKLCEQGKPKDAMKAAMAGE